MAIAIGRLPRLAGVLEVVEACQPKNSPALQSGAFADALHPQKNIFLVASAVIFTGAMPVSLWLPSQKGCLALLPQAHQK